MGKRLVAVFLSFLIAFAPYLGRSGLLFASNKPLPESELTEESLSKAQETHTDEEVAELQEILKGKPTSHPLDAFHLLRQTVLPQRIASRIRYNKIGLQILSSNDSVLQTAYSGTPEDASALGGVAARLIFQGTPFLDLYMPIRSAVFFNHYLVFLEEAPANHQVGTKQLLFIDLKYFESALGRTEVPVFRMLVESSASERLMIENGQLRFGDLLIPKRLFDQFSDAQQLAWNVTVNLVDPKTYEQGVVLAEAFTSAFDKALTLQGEQVETQFETIQALEKNREQMAEKLRGYFSEMDPGKKALLNLQQDPRYLTQVEKTTQSISENIRAQRKMMARLGHLFSRLSFPQPLGAPKVKQALGLVASGLMGKKFFGTSATREGILELINSKAFKGGAALGVGLLAGAMYPEQVAQFFWASLDVSRTVMDAVFGHLEAIGYQATMAVQKTLSGFSPNVVKKAYFTGDRLHKTFVGVSAILATLYVTLGVTHLVVNTIHLVKDLREMGVGAYQEKFGAFKGLIKAFIKRQDTAQREYLALLVDYQAGVDGREDVEFSPEENQAVDKIIDELETQRPLRRMLEKFNLSHWLSSQAEKSTRQIETFGQAMRHFLFSICSFTTAGSVYSRMWNFYFGVRSFVWRPTLWMTLVVYPHFLSALTARDGKHVIPSELNGGTRLFWEQSLLKWQKKFDPEYVERVMAWEDAIIDVEQAIQAHATRKAFHALVNYMGASPELKRLYEDGGIHALTDQAIQGLTSAQKAFFRNYFNELSNRSMTSFLQEVVRNSGEPSSESFDLRYLKEASLPQIEKIQINSHDSLGFVESQNETEIFEMAKEKANSTPLFEAAKDEIFYKKVKQLNPSENTQVYRMHLVKKQLQNPKAVARAVRAMIASNLIDKPQELVFTFICMAAIQDGILQPIQDEMFGPNSWFYLSKAVFANGFIYGVISGILADIWGKLQRDLIHEGHFDNIPDGKDAEGSYTRWLFKQTFSNKRNSLWKNQMHNLAIVWANMPAALTNYFIVQMITMGRFDLDMYIVGYLTVFLTPWSGLNAKLEQGFELAANYDLKHFNERLRSHPKVQAYFSQVSMRRRLWWNFFYKCYENIHGYMLMNFESMSTPRYGSRSLSRILFGGKTATAHVHRGIEAALTTRAGQLPGIRHVLRGCDYLLTNDFTDL